MLTKSKYNPWCNKILMQVPDFVKTCIHFKNFKIKAMSKSNPITRKIKTAMILFVLMAFLNMVIGCHYYKVATGSKSPASMNEYIQNYNYFILHHGDQAWAFHHTSINEDENELTGILGSLPMDHQYYLTTKTKGANQYWPKKGDPLNEVHIYVSDFIESSKPGITVPFSSIEKIEIYKKAIGATIASHVITIIGFIAIPILVILAVSSIEHANPRPPPLSTTGSGSCPYVYVYNGAEYIFIGELYPGSVYKTLERDDYMKLTGIKPMSNQLKLRISNELQENEYTDLAEIISVQHPVGTGAIIDKYGNIQIISAPVVPLSAKSITGKDLNDLLKEADNRYYLFDDYDEHDITAINSVVLEFEKPGYVNEGKLVVKGKNSLWSGHVQDEFSSLFGNKLQKWIRYQNKVPGSQHEENMLQQDIPLKVYLDNGKGWELIDYYNVAGGMAKREMVFHLDNLPITAETIKIKLETGYMFWEIDQVSMDFTQNTAYKADTLKPISAIDRDGRDVRKHLLEPDGQYLKQRKGDRVEVIYELPEDMENGKACEYTLIMHSRGYYNILKNYKGKPKVEKLMTMQGSHSLSKFSKELYEKANKQLITNKTTK
jgi:hypothetical protein